MGGENEIKIKPEKKKLKPHPIRIEKLRKTTQKTQPPAGAGPRICQEKGKAAFCSFFFWHATPRRWSREDSGTFWVKKPRNGDGKGQPARAGPDLGGIYPKNPSWGSGRRRWLSWRAPNVGAARWKGEKPPPKAIKKHKKPTQNGGKKRKIKGNKKKGEKREKHQELFWFW